MLVVNCSCVILAMSDLEGKKVDESTMDQDLAADKAKKRSRGPDDCLDWSDSEEEFVPYTQSNPEPAYVAPKKAKNRSPKNPVASKSSASKSSATKSSARKSSTKKSSAKKSSDQSSEKPEGRRFAFNFDASILGKFRVLFNV